MSTLGKVFSVICASACLCVGVCGPPVVGNGVHLPPRYNSGFGNPYPPPLGESYIDPVFGQRIWRVTDAIAAGHDLDTVEYASSQHFNASETMFRVVTMPTGGAWENWFISPQPPFSVLRKVPDIGSSTPSDYWWHRTDPDLLYFIENNRLMVYDYEADAKRVEYTFAGRSAITGNGENRISEDGNRIALFEGRALEIFVYDFAVGAEIASGRVSEAGSFRITPAGDQVMVDEGPNGYNLYDIDLDAGQLDLVRDMADGFGVIGHQDVARAPDGNDYVFFVDSVDDNRIYAQRFDTGESTMILDIGWAPEDMNVGVHVSANSTPRDGWVYISTYADNVPNHDPTLAWHRFADELIRVSYDGSCFERLAHLRSGGYPDPRIDGYWSTPRASVSASGRFVVWNSHYLRQLREAGVRPDYVDVYLMEPLSLPLINSPDTAR